MARVVLNSPDSAEPKVESYCSRWLVVGRECWTRFGVRQSAAGLELFYERRWNFSLDEMRPEHGRVLSFRQIARFPVPSIIYSVE